MTFTNGKYAGAVSLALNHVGSAYTPRRVVVHYTVTDTLAAAKSALNNASGGPLSYHFLIEANGTVNQTRAPDRRAAHAGRSNWKAASGVQTGGSVNPDAVSISFINRGFFGHRNGTDYFDLNAHNNLIGKVYPASAVATTASIYDPGKMRHWHRYTEAQLNAAEALIKALRDSYDVNELVGHDDVAIDGKQDTGPLFPMAEWRQSLGMKGGLGLATTVASPDGKLSVRRRPSATSAEVAVLMNNDALHVRAVAYTYVKSNALEFDAPGKRYLTRWASVDIDGSNRHAGFVHMKLLANTPLTAALAGKL